MAKRLLGISFSDKEVNVLAEVLGLLLRGADTEVVVRSAEFRKVSKKISRLHERFQEWEKKAPKDEQS